LTVVETYVRSAATLAADPSGAVWLGVIVHLEHVPAVEVQVTFTKFDVVHEYPSAPGYGFMCTLYFCAPTNRLPMCSGQFTVCPGARVRKLVL
jgi:hypothetical protein